MKKQGFLGFAFIVANNCFICLNKTGLSSKKEIHQSSILAHLY